MAHVTAATAYDRIPYTNHPYRQAHHDQIAVAGVLHGLEPPAPATARVLEIGCGAGGHLLATAFALPGIEALGVDLAGTAIAAATADARVAGVANVRFEVADVRDLVDGRLGRFDYVIAHGVYAWVPPDVQDALLAAVRAQLAPGGLAYVSFNALPGGHLRGILRAACRFHARDAADDGERVAKAREMLELLQRWRSSDEPRDHYGRFLDDLVPRLLDAEDATLAHDLIEEHLRPAWYADFAAHAARHALEPVAESRLIESPMLPRTVEGRQAIADLAGGDRVAREQLVDLFGHGRFRETVLAHAGTASRADADPVALDRLRFLAAPPPETAPPGPGTELLAAAAAARPHASTLAELADATGLDDRTLRTTLLGTMRLGLVTAWLEPPRAVAAGERPRASALARFQAAAGRPATSLLHTVVVLDEAGAQLLGLLDGTRDLEALRAALLEATGLDLPAGALAANLRALAAAGLLEGDGTA